MNTWVRWLKETTREESSREIARRIATDFSSVARWKRDGRPSCGAVIKIARAYDADVLEGLVAAEWLTEQDAANIIGRALLSVPTRDLIAELHARGENAPGRRGFDDPPTDPTKWPPRD